MRAAIFSKKNSRKQLEVVEVPLPTPNNHEVLIRVHGAAVNPLDWRLKSRRPGVDLAGEVTSVGRRVTRFKAGDMVFGAGRGAFAEYACADESRLALKPDNLTCAQAAAVPIAGLTALQGLRDIGHLLPGQNVLIHGASGGVGTFAVQIATLLGGHVSGVCSTRNVDQARQLGAEHILDYTKTDFIREDARYHLILDNVGNLPLSTLKRMLEPRGRCVLVGATGDLRAILTRIVAARIWSLFHSRKLAFFIARANREDLQILRDLAGSGKVVPVIERVFPLREAGQAIAYVEQGHARAKVVIQPDR